MQPKFLLVPLLLASCLIVSALVPRTVEQKSPIPRRPNRIEDLEQGKVVVGLRKIANLNLRPRAATTANESTEIERLIANLAQIERPDFGLSPTMSGDAFLPVEGRTTAGAFLFTNHNLQTSPELKKLVELGPQALPRLLAALDDQRATKLTLKQEGIFRAMWFTNELSGNPNNALESKVLLKRTPFRGFGNEDAVTQYAVKVGDVCFVAIGQIVGRSYQAVRYQPTANIMINSPTHDVNLRRQVRQIWTSADARQKLFESLLLDYATEGVFNGRSLDGWELADKLQTNAALRLLYYFPQETAAMIAERIDVLKVAGTGPGSGSMHTDAEMDAWMKQTVANGVRADEFVKAVAWCREPAVEQALFKLFQRATNIDVILNSLPSVAPDHPDLVRQRLMRMLEAIPEKNESPFGDRYNLLVALGRYGGNGAKTALEEYLKPNSVLRCQLVCRALRESRREFTVDLLSPLLSDRRETDEALMRDHAPVGHIRICDEAAETISLTKPALKFEAKGEYADLDRQIEAIRRTIASQKK